MFTMRSVFNLAACGVAVSALIFVSCWPTFTDVASARTTINQTLHYTADELGRTLTIAIRTAVDRGVQLSDSASFSIHPDDFYSQPGCLEVVISEPLLPRSLAPAETARITIEPLSGRVVKFSIPT